MEGCFGWPGRRSDGVNGRQRRMEGEVEVKNGGLDYKVQKKEKREPEPGDQNHDRDQNGAGAAGRVCSMSVRLSCRGCGQACAAAAALGWTLGSCSLWTSAWRLDPKCEWRMVVHLAHWSRRPTVVVVVVLE